MANEVFYVVYSQAGGYLAVDMQSSGYPYIVNDFARAEHMSSLERANHWVTISESMLGSLRVAKVTVTRDPFRDIEIDVETLDA